ncbi:unnamed protein product [Caenorhabditis sp. 36 PRJEB53466]|nr:unnamed protein product [Caenorhabditis sp. 36 PRJEB53466]
MYAATLLLWSNAKPDEKTTVLLNVLTVNNWDERWPSVEEFAQFNRRLNAAEISTCGGSVLFLADSFRKLAIMAAIRHGYILMNSIYSYSPEAAIRDVLDKMCNAFLIEYDVLLVYMVFIHKAKKDLGKPKNAPPTDGELVIENLFLDAELLQVAEDRTMDDATERTAQEAEAYGKGPAEE